MWALWPGGCLLISTSLTVRVFGVLESMWSFRCKMPPSSPFERRSKAALRLPANHRLAKERARFSLGFDVENLGNLPVTIDTPYQPYQMAQ